MNFLALLRSYRGCNKARIIITVQDAFASRLNQLRPGLSNFEMKSESFPRYPAYVPNQQPTDLSNIYRLVKARHGIHDGLCSGLGISFALLSMKKEQPYYSLWRKVLIASQHHLILNLVLKTLQLPALLLLHSQDISQNLQEVRFTRSKTIEIHTPIFSVGLLIDSHYLPNVCGMNL